MSGKVDSDQVFLMRLHLPAGVVAERLGVSERQIRRVHGRNATKHCRVGRLRPDECGTRMERALWKHYLRKGESSRRVAYRFGVAHQTILNHVSGG